MVLCDSGVFTACHSGKLAIREEQRGTEKSTVVAERKFHLWKHWAITGRAGCNKSPF